MKQKEKRAPRLVESRALGILAGAAIVVIGIISLILPRVQALRPDGELDAAAARAELARVEASVRAVKAYGQSIANYGAALHEAALLPDAPEVPELVRGIDAAARAAGVELTTISAGVRPSGKGAGSAVIPVDLTLAAIDARYEEFKKFVNALEQSMRLIDVISLTYQPDAQTLSIKAAAYVLNPTANPTGNFDERQLTSDMYAGLRHLAAPHDIPNPSGGRLNPFATSTLTP